MSDPPLSDIDFKNKMAWVLELGLAGRIDGLARRLEFLISEKIDRFE